MDVSWLTWTTALLGMILILLLGGLQVVAVLRPHADWTVTNVYGGSPATTDPTAYFAFNQGIAWGDVVLFMPLQIAGSLGMLFGQRWGFLLALAVSILYLYTAIEFWIWDRDLGFRQNTLFYWVVIWGMWPAFGLVQGAYTIARLLA